MRIRSHDAGEIPDTPEGVPKGRRIVGISVEGFNQKNAPAEGRFSGCG